MTIEAEYEVFISHATRLDPDTQELVDALAGALCRRGLKVFLDRRVFNGGEPLLSCLDHAICHSRVGMIVLTALAERSRWVEFEVETMARRRASGQMRILGLQIGSGCRPPGGIRPDAVISPSTVDDLNTLCNEVERAVRKALASF